MKPKQQESKSLGRLARRISAWTTNSLLTVILAVMAVGFGREVLHWWHGAETSPAAAPSVAADPLGDGTAPHVLEFGDQAWSIRRQEFSGPPSEVPAALQAACRAAIVDARPRDDSPDAAEQGLLKRLADQRPVAEEQGRWRIYAWGDGHPLLIGTRAEESREQGAGGHHVPMVGEQGAGGHHVPMVGEQGAGGHHVPMVGEQKAGSGGGAFALPAPRFTSGTSLDKTAYRVVIWGMAVPASVNIWTLYLFQCGGAAGGEGQGRGEIPLPPGGHRLVSIRAAVGGAITAFSAGNGDAARGFYDRWFADHGWTAARGWQQIASGWQVRYEMQSPAAALAVDIRLGIDSQGQWTGLVMESQTERGKP